MQAAFDALGEFGRVAAPLRPAPGVAAGGCDPAKPLLTVPGQPQVADLFGQSERLRQIRPRRVGVAEWPLQAQPIIIRFSAS